jgi:hypothetical protein
MKGSQVYPTKSAVFNMAAHKITWAEVLKAIDEPILIRDAERKRANGERFVQYLSPSIRVIVSARPRFDRHDTQEQFPLYPIIHVSLT